MRPALFAVVVALTACDTLTDADFEREATIAVKNEIAAQLDALVTSARALRAAAPTPDADGWNATNDAAAMATMRTEWKRARVAYERIEGAIAVLFPNLDASTDERYDGFIEGARDDDLFDGELVTGIHAIERILWADEHPAHVLAFESALPHYSRAAFPANEDEARRFEDGLAQRLVSDVERMQREFAPLALDAASAYRGVIGSLAEQSEKVALASTGEDESRYAQHTLADMRANLAGGVATFVEFAEWLQTKDKGPVVRRSIEDGFARVKAMYDALPGDAIPAVPDGWNPDDPTTEHLATPYGQLFALLRDEADPEKAGSLVSEMTKAADLLAIPRLP